MHESSSNQQKDEKIVPLIYQLSTSKEQPPAAFSSRPSSLWQLSKKANTSSSSSMTKPAASNPSSSLENSTLSTRISDHSPAEDSVPRCAVIQNLSQTLVKLNQEEQNRSRTNHKNSNAEVNKSPALFVLADIPLVRTISNVFSKSPKRTKLTEQGDYYDYNGNLYSGTRIFYFVGATPDIPERLLRFRRLSIEPKVPFANERTFLVWMEFATFLAGASIVFASFSDVKKDPLRQIIGLLMLPFSIGAIVYALHKYLERIKMIEHGAGTEKFVDTKGPIILSTIFILYLIVTLFVKI